MGKLKFKLILAVFFAGCSGAKNSTNASSTVTAARAPYAPNQIVLTVASSRQINLSWADNSTDETGFRIERALSNAGPFSAGTGPGTFAVVANVGANVKSYSDSSLSAGTFYYYRIFAYNSAGSSSPTNVANLQTMAAAVVGPTAPSGLNATATAASIINLSWVDNSTNENTFSLERSTDNGASFTLIAVIAANTTTYQDINLLEVRTYTYRIKAVNDIGASAVTANAMATTFSAGNTLTFAYVNTNIIAPNCVKCHGGGMVAAGVNLSTYAGVRAALIAGNAAGSRLYTEVNSGSMPPAGPLSALQISAIRNWIDAGALNN